MLQIPDHVTEAEVLALIEGDLGSLPAERRDVVREAVARDAVLSRIVNEIKADASAVVSFSRISAPPAIRARVIEDLRRPAPAPERIREPMGGEIPVSTVIVTTERPWRAVAERIPIRRLAAAASLLLAAGLSVWVIGKAINVGVEHARTATLATAGETPDVPTDFATPTRTHSSNVNPPALAGATATPVETGAPASTDDLALPGNPRTLEPQLAADEPPLGTPQGISSESALELARAGRLVIRVRAVNEADARHDIDQFAVRTSDDLKWRPLEAWELPQVTLALRDRAPKAIPYAAERPPAPIRAAAGDAPRSAPSLPPVEPIGVAADIADALKHADFHPLYTVEMDENERDLAALLQRLSKSKSHVAEFVALEEPLPTLIPSTEPNAVLWWSRPPSGWTRRVCVPIVLESHP